MTIFIAAAIHELTTAEATWVAAQELLAHRFKGDPAKLAEANAALAPFGDLPKPDSQEEAPWMNDIFEAVVKAVGSYSAISTITTARDAKVQASVQAAAAAGAAASQEESSAKVHREPIDVAKRMTEGNSKINLMKIHSRDNPEEAAEKYVSPQRAACSGRR